MCCAPIGTGSVLLEGSSCVAEDACAVQSHTVKSTGPLTKSRGGGSTLKTLVSDSSFKQDRSLAEAVVPSTCIQSLGTPCVLE